MGRRTAEPEPWFARELGLGLARLAALALPGAPIERRSAAACRAVWAEALWGERHWARERDCERLRIAFRALAARARRWPAPAELLELLPAAEEPAKLPPPPQSAEERERARRIIAELRERLRR